MMDHVLVNYQAMSTFRRRISDKSRGLFYDILSALGGEWNDMRPFSKEDLAAKGDFSVRDMSTRFDELIKNDLVRLTAEGYIVNPNLAQWALEPMTETIREWDEMRLISKKVWKI